LHERIKRAFTITKRGFVEVILAAGLLWTSLFAFEVASATAYAYPRYDYGQHEWALVLFAVVTIGLIAFSITRLIQLRVLDVVLMLGAFCLVLPNPATPDRLRWKFNTFKAAYLESTNADPVAPPRFKIFDWGNRNTGLGGGVEFEAIVYDEQDNIKDWQEHAVVPLPEVRWVTAGEMANCRKNIRSLGEHFYYVSEFCG
jgi:hypothetical protein